MALRRDTSAQLDLAIDLHPRPMGRGGRRPGAGRKRGHRVSHGARPALSRHHVVHVTLRVRPEVARLRRRRQFQVVRGCIASGHRDGFRVVDFNVLSNHVHLVIEAADAHALRRGLQSLETRIALRLNRALGRRRGKVFADRYHARIARTPREVRSLLVYVLHNARHHGGRRASPAFDVFSSAASFDGWASPLPRSARWMREALAEPRATAPPSSWLLTTGWRRHGLIRLDEAPAGGRTPAPAATRTMTNH